MSTPIPDLDQLLKQAGLSAEAPPTALEWQNLLWLLRGALDVSRNAAQATTPRGLWRAKRSIKTFCGSCKAMTTRGCCRPAWPRKT